MEEDQRIIFLKGKKVILRPLRKETDLEKCVKWMNDQDVIRYLGCYLPTSFQEQEKWFDSLVDRKDDIILAMETLDGVHIGNIGLYRINAKDRLAMHGIVIGEKDYWGGGYGTEAGMLLLNYAFNTLNLRKVCSSVISFNKRSLNYHLKCGYQVVGAYRNDVFKNGKYHNRILLDVFKKEWLSYWKKYQK